MRKVLLTIAFDGTAYEGWKSQRAERGVCHLIAQAWRSVAGEIPAIISSSRTDAGVHAMGLCAHVVMPEKLHQVPVKNIVRALNAVLPPDVRILDVRDVADDFHARFDAIRKEYHYQIWNAPVMNPLLRDQAWHVPHTLNQAAIERAAARFLGRHDFRAFTSKREGVLGDTIREITCCEVIWNAPQIHIKISAGGFLYKMCRCIVGTLVDAGRGRIDAEKITSLLAGATRDKAGMNAPAHGLTLWHVTYPPFTDC